MFVQWIPAYQMDWESFALIGRTFARAFPESLMVCTNPARPSDYLFVGIQGKGGLDPNVAARNLEYAQKSRNIHLADSRIFYSLILSDELKNFFGDGSINTDNHPLLEYHAPRTMHQTDDTIIRKIEAGMGLNLSKILAARIRENQNDIDRQIGDAEYFLNFQSIDDSALRYRVDLASATTRQKERYADAVEQFCRHNVVTDFSLIVDSGIRERCFSAQQQAAAARLEKAEDKAPLYSHLGLICLRNRRPEKAVEYFSREIALNPGDKVSLNNLGTAYTSLGLYAEAIEQFSKALKIDPDYAQAHANIGICLASQGRSHLDEAIRHYRAALNIAPEDADTHYNLGSALMAEGNFNEAAAHFMKALQLRPGFSMAQADLQKAMAMLR
jgi:spermidine synthase